MTTPAGKTKPLISIVMCTYNRAPVLARQLESLVSQKTDGLFDYEIVVVDDASSDDTVHVIAQFAARSPAPLHVAQAGGKGIAHARNCQVEAAHGDWLAFTDDDQVNEPDWLYELYVVAQRTRADVVGGTRDLLLEGEPPFALTAQTRGILGEVYREERQILVRDDMPSTGSALVKRAVMDAVGPFDPTLEWSGEDDLFARRILAAGFRVWFAPKSVVHHIIAPYRLTPTYYRWASLRVGVALAEVDCRMRGKKILPVYSLARLARAVLVHLPNMTLSYLKGDMANTIDRKCYMWRALSYTYATCHLFFPRMFPRRKFLDSLIMRRERSIAGTA